MDDVHIDGLMLRGTNPAVDLDFSAITKGYGVDLAIGHLRELGVRHAMVSAGGTVRVIGERSGQPWRITVRRPSGSGVLAVLQLRGDESIATVADYERNFDFEGKTYHQPLDPRTGYPAAGARSVTVIHSDAATAEGAATALFIAGPEAWVEIRAAPRRALRDGGRQRGKRHHGSCHGQTRRVCRQRAGGPTQPAVGRAGHRRTRQVRGRW